MNIKSNYLLKISLSLILSLLFSLSYAQDSSATATAAEASVATSTPIAEPASSAATAPEDNTAATPTDAAAAIDAPELAADGVTAAPPITDLAQLDDFMGVDLTAWQMFTSAGLIVQIVMLILGFLSVMSWAIAVAKYLELRNARKQVTLELAEINQQDSFDQAKEKAANWHYANQLLAKAEKEISLSAVGSNTNNIKDRIASGFNDFVSIYSRRIAKGISPLATVGSVSPFIGLFGTVWGIMNSFIGIAQTQTTNLAVVAPGIAEALLATALGLVAAIPAVILYNYFSKAVAGYRAAVADLASAVMLLTSRMLDNSTVNTKQH